jgi:3-deoxy-manno-octulosonate cytidylyltransferase (CMP-KDO synthetase)
MTDFKVIILAVFNENNFPNKAMSDIHGKPMIQHVFESAINSGASEIVLATDSPRVGMVAEDFGATVCMIVDNETEGLSLLTEVIDKMGWDDDTVLVNFPGDAPLTPGSIIMQVAKNLVTQEAADCATLFSYVSRKVAEKNYTVCMTIDKDDYVMYLSRCPIPHQGSLAYDVSRYRSYIGINAYRAGHLRRYSQLPRCELDAVENIEELTLLYNGVRIHAAEANSLIGQRVITEADIEKVKIQIAPGR